MPDIIQLLPGPVADQIAAGEVIQRPASVVKELLENSIDAESTRISLVVKDAGKTLIQVVDDGKGMSTMDARMCFERHATSKIRNAEELFSIITKGFRGEAMASIAAIAQVNLKTRQAQEDLGTEVLIEGSEVLRQEPCSCSPGCNISVKNLFFNVPARRKFLKSDPVEMRHIIEEFTRVAMAHPGISFQMEHNGNQLFDLPVANIKQRILHISGRKFEQRLVPVEEDTDIASVKGFVGKPVFARKTRGEQYLFVNQRYIKSAYLNHAVNMAFQGLLPKDHFPSYYLFLSLPPNEIDINIHPTKTEVKFSEERNIYAIVRSAVKRSLGQFNISPSLDFEQETAINIPPLRKGATIASPIKVDFDPSSFLQAGKPNEQGTKARPAPSDWKELHAITQSEVQLDMPLPNEQRLSSDWNDERPNSALSTYQLHNKYILAHLRNGFTVVDQRRAHERILYEELLEAMAEQQVPSQQLLFPAKVELGKADLELLRGMEQELKTLGIGLAEYHDDHVLVDGLPTQAAESSAEKLIHDLVEAQKHHVDQPGQDQQEALAAQMARSMAIPRGRELDQAEMSHMIDRLFACQVPYFNASGKPTVITFSLEELDKRFER